MEILNFLLSFFLNEHKDDDLKPVFDFLSENSFDLKSMIKNFNPSVAMPIIKTFFKYMNKGSNENDAFGLEPIKQVADETIYSSLTQYFDCTG